MHEARDWEHGVFMGATMSSETTAAEAGSPRSSPTSSPARSASSETAIGLIPPLGDAGIDTDGLDFAPAAIAELLAVDADGWKAQLPQVRAHLALFGERLPGELHGQLEALERRLG